MTSYVEKTAKKRNLKTFGVEDFWDDGVESELKSTKRILACVPEESRCCRMYFSPMYFRLHHPLICLPVCRLQGVLQGACDVLQVGQHQSLKGFHDHGRQDDRPVVIESCDRGFLGDRDDCVMFEAGGTSHSSSDRLKICVKMLTGWSAQTFRQEGETPPGPGAFLTFCLWKS